MAEQEARNRSESAAQQADGAIRVAKENAQKEAELARAEREKARLQAEIVVPANANREQVIINAEAGKQQAIRHAEGQAAATLANMRAEGEGVEAILAGKALGYQKLVEACRTAEQVAALLMIEKLTEVAGIQAKAIQDLPIEKIIVWDGGKGGDGESGGLSGLGGRLMGVLPPMHELAKQVGLDLPGFLGKVADNTGGSDDRPKAARKGGKPGKDADGDPEVLEPVG